MTDHSSDRTYRFELEGGCVTAIPRNGDDDPVRFDGSVAAHGDPDDPEANWEPIVGALVGAGLGTWLRFEDGLGIADRDAAARALASSDVGPEDGRTAHALIEYLAEQGIFGLDGSDVIVLPCPDVEHRTDRAPTLTSWAAAIEVVGNRLDDAIQRLRTASERIDRQRDHDADDDTVGADVTKRLTRTVDDLESMRMAFEDRATMYRTAALTTDIRGDESIDVDDELHDAIAAIADAFESADETNRVASDRQT